jgi:hypothetical protein
MIARHRALANALLLLGAPRVPASASSYVRVGAARAPVEQKTVGMQRTLPFGFR